MPAAAIELLGPQHLDELKALLGREPVHNLYLLGLLEEFGVVPRPGRATFALHGRFIDGALTAAVFVGGEGGMLVPSASTPMAVSDIAKSLTGKVKPGALLGEKGCIDAMVQQLAPNARPRLSRTQRLFSVSADDLGPFTNPTLRLATDADLNALVELASGSVKEMLDRDPLEEDPEGFVARVKQRIKGKRTYVLEAGGRLVLKVDVGSRSAFGAELEGIYTIPEERRRGHATLSLGQISRHLLSSLPRLTIRVDDMDPGLAGVARKVGYVAGRAQRLVLMQ